MKLHFKKLGLFGVIIVIFFVLINSNIFDFKASLFPTGGSITYTGGLISSTSVNIVVNDGDTNTGSELNHSIERQEANYSGNVCLDFISWNSLGSSTGRFINYPIYTDNSIQSDKCYKYRYIVSNSSGETVTYTGENILMIDSLNPIVSNVISNGTGNYKAGDSINIQIQFNEVIYVNGIPQLGLSTGNPSETLINYIGGSGTNTLNFSYTVGTGNYSYDLSYSSTSSLALNGGSIKDLAGNDVITYLLTPGFTGSLSYNNDIKIIPKPFGGSISYFNGTQTGEQILVNFNDGFNLGIDTGSMLLERQVASYSGGVCQSFGEWQSIYTGTYVGERQFSTGNTVGSQIYINKNNILYSYGTELDNGNKISVMKFNGSSWEYVGQRGFSQGYAANINLSIDSNNVPYIAYQEWGPENGNINSKISVMKFNGSSWEYVGQRGFSQGYAANINLSIDSNNVPYVGYCDQGISSCKATVMKFNGTSWEYVGQRHFSLGVTSNNKLKLDSNNTPYVSFADYSNGVCGELSVMKFNGTSWEYVGQRGFSQGHDLQHSFNIDKNNVPYIIYHLPAGGLYAMKFDGSLWGYLGGVIEPYISNGDSIGHLSISNDTNNIPFISYVKSQNSVPYHFLNIIKFDGSNWNKILRKSNGGNGGFNSASLMFDTTNNLFIGYEDYDNNTKQSTSVIKVVTNNYTFYIHNSYLDNAVFLNQCYKYRYSIKNIYGEQSTYTSNNITTTFDPQINPPILKPRTCAPIPATPQPIPSSGGGGGGGGGGSVSGGNNENNYLMPLSLSIKEVDLVSTNIDFSNSNGLVTRDAIIKSESEINNKQSKSYNSKLPGIINTFELKLTKETQVINNRGNNFNLVFSAPKNIRKLNNGIYQGTKALMGFYIGDNKNNLTLSKDAEIKINVARLANKYKIENLNLYLYNQENYFFEKVNNLKYSNEDFSITANTDKLGNFAIIESDKDQISAGFVDNGLHGGGPKSFTDIQNQWFTSYVENLASKGLIQGRNGNKFYPGEGLKRTELAKLAVLAFNIPLPEKLLYAPFKDTSLDQWYAPYVIALKQKGIFIGYPDGTFKPNENVKRAEVIKILLLAKGETIDINDKSAIKNFNDVDYNAWYIPYISKAVKQGFIDGYKENNGVYFKAGKDVFRGEIAKMISLLIEK